MWYQSRKSSNCDWNFLLSGSQPIRCWTNFISDLFYTYKFYILKMWHFNKIKQDTSLMSCNTTLSNNKSYRNHCCVPSAFVHSNEEQEARMAEGVLYKHLVAHTDYLSWARRMASLLAICLYLWQYGILYVASLSPASLSSVQTSSDPSHTASGGPSYSLKKCK